MRHKSVQLTLLLLVVCLVAACTAPVTYQGQAVTDQATLTAARAIHAADKTGASIAKWLIASHKNGLIPEEVLETYRTDIGPAFQAALGSSKTGLETAINTPSEDATENLLAHTATLMEVLNQAIALAAKYGW